MDRFNNMFELCGTIGTIADGDLRIVLLMNTTLTFDDNYDEDEMSIMESFENVANDPVLRRICRMQNVQQKLE